MHPIKDSSSKGRSEVLRSLYNQYGFNGRSGVTPAHVAVDLRRRTLVNDPDLEAGVVDVIGGLRDDGLVIGGHRLQSPVSLTSEGKRQGANPMPPAIVGGRGSMR